MESMKHIICDRLARMASVAAQERYITNGSADSYYVPDELLEDVAETGNLASKAMSLSANEQQAIQSFLCVLDDSWPPRKPPEYLSDAWCAIRNAAQACLRALDFELSAWEAKEIVD
jgi:hypothetical protein